jgi:hypothetical protein
MGMGVVVRVAVSRQRDGCSVVAAATGCAHS